MTIFNILKYRNELHDIKSYKMLCKVMVNGNKRIREITIH